jgi:hypothetical protein
MQMFNSPPHSASTARSADRISLRCATSGVVIVAHREDTGELKNTLVGQGFSVDEVRGPYTTEQLKFSAIMRCLVNHANAWKIAATRTLPSIIVEADFVPVRGFGDLPSPLPVQSIDHSLGYLYSVAPQVWDLAQPDIARGHGGGMVALVVPQKVAVLLLQYFEETLLANPQGSYLPFDTQVGYWLMARGIESYIPYRHYGEHGGIGNPEHARAGLGRPHQADVLHGPLAFLPPYAMGKVLRFWRTRIRARSWGILRLAAGRFLAPHDLARQRKSAMLRFAVGRQLTAKRPVESTNPRCAVP